jgi:phage/plasmid-like protein (TIGR03299 family)
MAHEIEFNKKNQSYSFVSHSEKAWHGLGKIVQNAMTSKEVIENANLDYEVEKTTIHAKIGESLYQPYDEKFATYRKDTNEVLGLVGGRYEIVQNKDAFSFFDAIIDEGEAIFETAGVLGKGEKIFATAKLPNDLMVNGEPCEKYIVLTNSHDGSSSIIAGLTTIRVVCNNTLQAALKGLSNKVSIKHTMGAKERLAEAYKVMGIASVYMKEVEGVFNQMAKTTISDEQLKSYIQNVMKPEYKILHETTEEEEKLSTRFKNQVDSIYEFALSHTTQNTNAARGTLWGAYNSISGYYNYIAKFKNEEDKFKSQFFGLGNTKINKAFSLATELAI